MDKKSQQLGMPFGTATGRLERQILFMLVKQCGRDTCHRCGKPIERSEDLSIEHKQPWQDTDPALFWDLDNIAFSHKRCNYGVVRRVPKQSGTHLRLVGPPGTAWCRGHISFLPVKEFWKNKNRWNGLQAYCKICQDRLSRASNQG